MEVGVEGEKKAESKQNKRDADSRTKGALIVRKALKPPNQHRVAVKQDAARASE